MKETKIFISRIILIVLPLLLCGGVLGSLVFWDSRTDLSQAPQLTHDLQLAHALAYDSHLDNGGTPIGSTPQLAVLDLYLGSRKWVVERPRIDMGGKLVDLGPKHIDGFGMPFTTRKEGGSLILISCGEDLILDTSDDISFPIGPWK